MFNYDFLLCIFDCECFDIFIRFLLLFKCFFVLFCCLTQDEVPGLAHFVEHMVRCWVRIKVVYCVTAEWGGVLCNCVILEHRMVLWVDDSFGGSFSMYNVKPTHSRNQPAYYIRMFMYLDKYMFINYIDLDVTWMHAAFSRHHQIPGR